MPKNELTVVRYQHATGERSYVRMLVELARFAATPPREAERRRALQTQYVDVVAARGGGQCAAAGPAPPAE